MTLAADYELEEKPEACECCDSTDVPLKTYGMNRHWPQEDKKKWLCILCASTAAGNAFEYPEQYRGSADILSAISFVGNMILKEIRKGQDSGKKTNE